MIFPPQKIEKYKKKSSILQAIFYKILCSQLLGQNRQPRVNVNATHTKFSIKKNQFSKTLIVILYYYIFRLY